LVEPIIKQIENEREERARVEVKYDKAIKRLTKVEELVGCEEDETRPKAILDMENDLADMKMLFKSQVVEM